MNDYTIRFLTSHGLLVALWHNSAPDARASASVAKYYVKGRWHIAEVTDRNSGAKVTFKRKDLDA